MQKTENSYLWPSRFESNPQSYGNKKHATLPMLPIVGGKRIGFDIVTLDGSSRAPLARVATSVKGPKVGQYTVILSDFEFLAQKSLNSKSIENSQHVIIDEIGKMENFSSKFQAMVRKIFESDSKHILATIPVKYDSIGLVKDIVNRSDTEIIEVTKDNRDSIKDIILQKLI